MARFRRHLRAPVFGALLAATLGCSGSDDPAYPVEFKVLVKGKPAVGAVVVLHPVGKSDPNARRPTGKVGEDGTVKLSTFAQDDGAPPGDYTLTVEWRDEIAGADQVKEPGPDKLKGRYSKPDGPGAPRVTIQKQPNALPDINL